MINENLELEIINYEKKALSWQEIRRFFEGNVNIISYEDLFHIESINEIFDENNRVILFYPVESKFSGHYVALWKNNENYISYYDPYGMTPMEDINHSSYLLRNKYNAYSLPYLFRKFRKAGGVVDINNFRNQEIKQSINTCGRHCMIRLLHKHLNHYEYNQYLKYRGLSKDIIVSFLTWFV